MAAGMPHACTCARVGSSVVSDPGRCACSSCLLKGCALCMHCFTAFKHMGSSTRHPLHPLHPSTVQLCAPPRTICSVRLRLLLGVLALPPKLKNVPLDADSDVTSTTCARAHMRW